MHQAPYIRAGPPARQGSRTRLNHTERLTPPLGLSSTTAHAPPQPHQPWSTGEKTAPQEADLAHIATSSGCVLGSLLPSELLGHRSVWWAWTQLGFWALLTRPDCRTAHVGRGWKWRPGDPLLWQVQK